MKNDIMEFDEAYKQLSSKPNAEQLLETAKLVPDTEGMGIQAKEIEKKISQLIVMSADLPFSDFAKVTKEIKKHHFDSRTFVEAKKQIELDMKKYGLNNKAKSVFLSSVVNELIINFNETPSKAKPGFENIAKFGVYVGRNTEKAQEIRQLNGKGLLEKQKNNKEEGTKRAIHIATLNKQINNSDR